MSHALVREIGSVVSLWRYPVKSMIGEELHLAQIRDEGLLGDRSYAVLDQTDGKVATAKNPRKWPTLFTYRAKYVEAGDSNENVPHVQIILPNGGILRSEQHDLNQTLSQLFHRKVHLLPVAQGTGEGTPSSSPGLWTGQSEEYWPDIGGRVHRDTTTNFTLPRGTFFDAATIHLLTTATLNQLRTTYPSGCFDIPRFRPNIVVEPTTETEGFIENSWIGHTVAIGDEVRLRITGPCGRCVMTTLPQGHLPNDHGILRTVLQQNQGNVGVYAEVIQTGTIRQGDRMRVEP